MGDDSTSPQIQVDPLVVHVMLNSSRVISNSVQAVRSYSTVPPREMGSVT